MLTIETTELEISDELKRKVEMICKFACAKPTITNATSSLYTPKDKIVALIMWRLFFISKQRANTPTTLIH